MSDGIQKSAGDSLHRILNFMTGNRLSAVLTGVGITAIVQSSSATTVMTVSFVNAAFKPAAGDRGYLWRQYWYNDYRMDCIALWL